MLDELQKEYVEDMRRLQEERREIMLDELQKEYVEDMRRLQEERREMLEVKDWVERHIEAVAVGLIRNFSFSMKSIYEYTRDEISITDRFDYCEKLLRQDYLNNLMHFVNWLERRRITRSIYFEFILDIARIKTTRIDKCMPAAVFFFTERLKDFIRLDNPYINSYWKIKYYYLKNLYAGNKDVRYVYITPNDEIDKLLNIIVEHNSLDQIKKQADIVLNILKNDKGTLGSRIRIQGDKI